MRFARWRTVIAIEILGVMLLLGLLLACSVDESLAAVIATMFIAFASAIVGLATNLAGKSAVEHLASGGGVKGAAKALLTNTKPEQPPIEQSPQ
ncbi:MAG: hypothetical protein A2Y75_01480 [Candidatus Solincola sediminis]|uniref:Uncharacterized protein n=1 Tax=Candidatus Solincola sediminis TaxID=1797199 RepID=A0A1F2WNG9_9ACTN|nr:MAG: hypothetical protein A2Y75_01480 [Candidatus Solincola sediminis]